MNKLAPRVREVEGDLIELAQRGAFFAIIQGCNCWNKQKSGLARRMVEAFQTDQFHMETKRPPGEINKLGCIDMQQKACSLAPGKVVRVINCYTQYHWASPSNPQPLDYEALALCLRKVNHLYAGRHIGMPRIGAGLAGGDWDRIQSIIFRELKDCWVTIVNRV